MHSVFSDGTNTPEELIEKAVTAQLSAVALTDHDTVKGVDCFLRAATTQGVQGISGVEVSTSYYGAGAMHLLGYFVNHLDPLFLEQLKQIRATRQSRNEEILRNLHKSGMMLSMQEVASFAGDDVIGRPHFAQALVARGYARNTKEAFKHFLARGAAAYARRRTLTAEESLHLIRNAGGLPVLAHPITLEATPGQLRELVAELKDRGLAGLEVYHSQHSPARVRDYLKLAQDFDLVPTGGSDYHGARSPDIRIGCGFGTLRVPDHTVDRLRERLG